MSDLKSLSRARQRSAGRVFPQLLILTVATLLLVTLTTTWARERSIFGQSDLFIDVRHELLNGYVDEPDSEEMMEAAVQGMIESLDDPYTSFLDQEDLKGFNKSVRGSFSGIGAEVNIENNRLQIVTPLEDSPAYNAGVLAGDVVLEIDGVDTFGMEIDECIDRLTGPRGTDVTILVRHENGEEATITITRDIINIQVIRGWRRMADQHFDFMLDDENRIGYIRLSQFNGNSAGALAETLIDLRSQRAQAIILDLRFNPGGLLDAAIQISDMFLTKDQRIVSVKGRNSPELVEFSTRNTLMPDIPLVVLINEASASASEIVSGALGDNGRAFIVGTRSFGKGSVQQVRLLEGGASAIKMTTARYYLPNGRSIHRKPDAEKWGVDPSEGGYVPMNGDALIEMLRTRRESDKVTDDNLNQEDIAVTPDWLRDERKDPQLAAALEAALGYLADGQWPYVGVEDVDVTRQLVKLESLKDRRGDLLELLAELDKEISEVESGEMIVGLEDETESELDTDVTAESTLTGDEAEGDE